MSTTLRPIELNCLAIPAAELAERLNVSERHLWGMLKSGRLGPQPLALGRAKRWPVAEIEAWLAAGAPDRAVWQALRESPSA